MQEMITPQRLISYVTADPFRPFRINIAGGQTLEIRHPDMVGIGRSSAHIDLFMSDDPELVKERVRKIPWASIESVEPLEIAATTGGK
jgi:hypothetical protein